MLPTSSVLRAAVATAGAAASGAARDVPAATPAKAPRKASSRSAAGAAEKKLGVLVSSGVLPGLVRAVGTSRATSTRRAATAGYATATTSKTDPLAFLRDPKLSIEEKLLKLLGHLNAKWDKEMQEKLDKIAAGEGGAKTTAASKPKKKGLLGSLAGAFAGALGGTGLVAALKVPAVKTALKKLGGPVLAAAASALGFPAAAPLLLKYGPTLVDAAMGLASAAGGKGSASSKTSQATSASGAMSDSERQTVLMEIQRIQSKQQEMFGLVSNLLKANHDTRTSIIQNIR